MFRYNDTMFDTRLDANTAAVEDWLTASGRNTAAETRAYLATHGDDAVMAALTDSGWTLPYPGDGALREALAAARDRFS